MVGICQAPNHIQPELCKGTIMMTDMFASAEFAEKHGNWAAYEKRLKHNSLLLPLVEEHGGALVEIVGDSLMAFFDDTEDAVRCASAMQERLVKYNQTIAVNTRDLEIHIRVGIHCGQVIVHEQFNNIALTGKAVNVTARVLAADAKRTDQILITNSVREQLRNQPEFVTERIGSWNVKGIAGLVLHRFLWREIRTKNQLKTRATQNEILANRIPCSVERRDLATVS